MTNDSPVLPDAPFEDMFVKGVLWGFEGDDKVSSPLKDCACPYCKDSRDEMRQERMELVEEFIVECVKAIKGIMPADDANKWIDGVIKQLVTIYMSGRKTNPLSGRYPDYTIPRVRSVFEESLIVSMESLIPKLDTFPDNPWEGMKIERSWYDPLVKKTDQGLFGSFATKKVDPDPELTVETILGELRTILAGRQDSYDHPADNFELIAEYWSLRAQDVLSEGKKFNYRHVADFMMLMKIARGSFKDKDDNEDDISGYAIGKRRARHEFARRARMAVKKAGK